jgi:hypothetical protein
VQYLTTAKSPRDARSQAVAVPEQHTLMRGVVHGVLLSMVVWTAALYLTLTLR